MLPARAVEIFLDALLTRADQYAASRSAKTLTVGHLYGLCVCVIASLFGCTYRHYIVQEALYCE